MKLSSLARTIRTIRHLRLSQVYWRLRYRLERCRPAIAPQVPETIKLRDDFPDVPPVLHVAENDDSNGDDLVARMEKGIFQHLNESRELGRSPTDWMLGDVTDGRLWAITLHYHAWAWQLAERAARGGDDAERADAVLRSLLTDWIENCGLGADGAGELAWNSYAIATRIGWWCRLYHLLGREGRTNWGELERRFIRSLWQQAAYLSRHVEWDLRANHVLRDAVGLAWAGRFFDDRQARKWLAAATKLAVAQAKEQVLSDGGHFERSPMYHIHVMEDLLVPAALVEDPNARERIRETWRSMAEFLAWTRHPDGQIPLFNDSGLNGACHPRDMLSLGSRALNLQINADARRGGKLLDRFGLAVWHGERWSVFFDVGRVSVDYQPGHAHADTLSIEASYEGERLFVDPGTFGYDNDESRRYDRSTASHNTLSIDAADSSEVWGIFRVGRRARPADIRCACRGEDFTASASHDGFAHLPGRPRHGRKITVTADRCLTILDKLTGSGRHTVEGGLFLDPRWTAEEQAGGWLLRNGRKHVSVLLEDIALKRFTEKRPYHCGYGRCEQTARLCWQGMLQFPYETLIIITPIPGGE